MASPGTVMALTREHRIEQCPCDVPGLIALQKWPNRAVLKYDWRMGRGALTAALADIAAGQRGFIMRAQVVAAGADDDDLRHAARGGWLVRAGHGLYRVAGAGVRANDELYAAWLRLAPGRDVWERLTEPDAIVAGASAATVYGIGDVPERVHEFIVFRRTQTRDPSVRLHLRRDIGSVQWRVADDLPVQEPVHLAAWILDHGEGDPGHVGQLVQEAIATGLVDLHQAQRALAPVARRWNIHVGTLLGETAARHAGRQVTR
jgi:Transcriptional regulator, AbiEi antitoxin